MALSAQDGRTFLRDAEKLHKEGRLDAALEQYGFALRATPGYVKALQGRASLYLDMGRMADRMADLEEVAKLTPKDGANLTQAAVACLDAREPGKARGYADAALALSGRNMEALQTKVRACLALKDVPCATTTADAALSLKGTTDTYYLHALSRMASGDFTTADADLDKVLEWNPLYEAAYVASGEAQLNLHKEYRGVSMQIRALEKAINRCTRGLELNPGSTELLIVRSKAFALQKEFAKAIDDVSKCVALGREDSVVYFQRALYYHGFGQEQNAVNDLNKLLLQDPDNVRFLLLRAECREANLDLDGAANDLSLASKLMKADAAWTAADLKRVEEAKERVKARVFEMNREGDPPSITVLELLSVIEGDVYIADWTRSHANFFRAVQIEKNVMFIILLLIVAVAAFNIVSTLVMAVTDKESDIAILRTLGASPGSIMQVFIVQGALIGVIGLALGLAGGVALALNIDVVVPAIERLFNTQFLAKEVYYISELPSDLQWRDVGVIAAVSFVLTLLATLYPSWRASRVNPAEALRYE